MNGLDKFLSAIKGTTAYTPARNLCKPTLNEIEPRRTCWHEVKMESRVISKPRTNLGVVVGPIVVQDCMNVQLFRYLSVHGPKELKEFDMAVAGKAGTITLPSRTFRAANRHVVPFLL